MRIRGGRFGAILFCHGLVVVVVVTAANAQTGLAPANQAAFDELVAGKQWQDPSDLTSAVVFLAPGRFRVPALPESGEGDYGWDNTGADTGTLTLTWDEFDNDPEQLRAEIALVFASATTGTHEFVGYAFGRAVESISGDFEIVDAAQPVPALPPSVQLLLALTLLLMGSWLRYRRSAPRDSAVRS